MSETVRVTTLDNGVRVVTERMDHLETASLGIWAHTGARNEADHEHGISHLLEHMAFKGTTRRSAVQIAEEVEQVGGDLNAMTSHESTAYFARVLADDVPLGLDILTDILTGSVFDESELQREQNVIVQEIGAAWDTPDDIVHDLFQEAAFDGQTLGRSILGTPETVRGFARGDLDTYLADHYRGPDMIVAAAGAVDHEAIADQAARQLEAVSPQPGAKPETGSFTGGERRDVRDLEQANIVLGFPAPALTDPDYFTARVAAGILGGGMSSRLFQEVREKRGLCYSIYAFALAFRETGLLAVAAATAAEDVPELMTVTLAEIARAGEQLSDAETERAKMQFKAGLLMSRESTSNRAAVMARQLLTRDRIVPAEETIANIDAVTPQAVSAFIGKMCAEGKLALSSVGPVTKLDPVTELARQLGVRQAA